MTCQHAWYTCPLTLQLYHRCPRLNPENPNLLWPRPRSSFANGSHRALKNRMCLYLDQNLLLLFPQQPSLLPICVMAQQVNSSTHQRQSEICVSTPIANRKAGLISNLIHPDIELSTSPDQEKITSNKQPQVKQAGRFFIISLWQTLT